MEKKNMNEIIDNFKSTFDQFDITNIKYSVLVKLLDLIIDMMYIVKLDDHNKIQKLASFTKMLSSEYCRDMLEMKDIYNLYSSKIYPILIYFENEYGGKSSNKDEEVNKENIVKEEQKEVNIKDNKVYTILDKTIYDLDIVTKVAYTNGVKSRGYIGDNLRMHKQVLDAIKYIEDKTSRLFIEYLIFLCDSILFKLNCCYNAKTDMELDVENNKLIQLGKIFNKYLKSIKLIN